MAEPRAYSLKEVARMSGLSVGTLRTYIKAQRLRAKRLGNGRRMGRNEWRVSREEVARVFGV